MNCLRVLSWSFFMVLFLPFYSLSTSISPFPNLGEMAKHSEAVVLGRVIENYATPAGDLTRYFSRVIVEQSVRNSLQPGQEIIIRHYSYDVGEGRLKISGDAEMEEGQSYLLFLDQLNTGNYQLKMLSYGLFKVIEKDEKEYLLPDEWGLAHPTVNLNKQAVEPLKVYFKKRLISTLRYYLNSGDWDAAPATPENQAAFMEQIKMAPSYCVFTGYRWRNSPNPVNVVYEAGGDMTCSNGLSDTQNSISNLTGNYGGLTLVDAGTHTFQPTCNNGAYGSDFTTWANSSSGPGSRSITVQYDDPCSQIPDLSGCNGTLAVGGAYSGGPMHTFNGQSWNSAYTGFVLVNNNVGSCLCGSNTGYLEMMMHEMGHCVGLGTYRSFGRHTISEYESKLLPAHSQYRHSLCRFYLRSATTTGRVVEL